jgi:hypothetical protein
MNLSGIRATWSGSASSASPTSRRSDGSGSRWWASSVPLPRGPGPRQRHQGCRRSTTAPRPWQPIPASMSSTSPAPPRPRRRGPYRPPRRQARRVREAAGPRLRRHRRPGAACRRVGFGEFGLFQQSLLPRQSSGQGDGHLWRHRRTQIHHRLLPPGLAAAGDRLELAPPTRGGGPPPGGRRQARTGSTSPASSPARR